ncbi:MAG TPA: flagellar filament capping protein FliD [bacterium]|jgi:flagellar hook-associated protein 2
MATSTAQVTGLASGIQWQQTIEMIMQIESQPMVALEQRKEDYQAKLAAWQNINSKLLALKTTMDQMNELDEILSKAAESSDETVLTATASSSAATGSYAILVNQLALNDKWTDDTGVADMNETELTSTAATFTYSYGGDEVIVEVPAGTTLVELVQIINNDVNNPGVTASILNDGTGTDPYHLILSGDDTGLANAISGIAETLDNFSPTFINTQIAQNAQIRVDGYPPTEWIESDSNEITDVIQGITIQLNTTSATEVTISVTNDTDAAKEQIEAFVSAYNEVVGLINLNVAYNAETEEAGVLFGDSTAIGIKGDLQSVLAATIPGLASDAFFQSLSEIGIKSGTGGLLSITDSDLEEALTDDFDAVGELFAFSSSSTSNYLTYFYSQPETQGGVYTVEAFYDASGNLLDTTTINGHPVQIDGDYIIGLDGYPEEGLRIKFTNPGGGAGSLTAEVCIAKGAAQQISDRVSFLTDPIDGTVHFAQEGIENTIESIDDQIADWETRLEAIQAQLEREFLAMEMTISQLQGQGNYISAMIGNL